MKLILCPACSDVVSLLVGQDRSCHCGKIGGRYVDDLTAEVWGTGFVLGFSNQSLVSALREQQIHGDLTEPLGGIYGTAVKGREFSAFVVPDSASTVRRISTSTNRPNPQTLEKQYAEPIPSCLDSQRRFY